MKSPGSPPSGAAARANAPKKPRLVHTRTPREGLKCARVGRAAAAGVRRLNVFLLTIALMLPAGGNAEVPVEIWRFHTRADCLMSAEYLNRGREGALQRYVCVETSPARMAELRRALEPDPTVLSRALSE
jgi:hypothetical protein